MKKLLAALCGLFLLAGCAAPVETPEEPDLPPSEKTAASEEYIPALTIPLTDLEPYRPLESMTPDKVPVDTMGEILCDETLPGGTRVVCCWHPDHLTDPAHQYEKYWAIHLGDQLLRFCAEESGYDYGYGVTPFSGVLGKDGFRIEAPRGAAYTAFDYYVLNEDGVPELLMDCTNNVLEADTDGDGVKELLYDYHAGQFVTYCFLRDEDAYQVELMSLLAEHLPFRALAAGDVGGWQEAGLPVNILAGGWDVIDEPFLQTHIDARLCLTPSAVEVWVPAALTPLETVADWAGKRCTLIDGAPACQDIVFSGEEPPEWTILGPAVPAPRAWAEEDLAGRNQAKTWSDVSEPGRVFMKLVSAREGWLVVSMGRGVAGADTYVYRTHDGGGTWQEASGLTEMAWHPCAAAFFDGLHAIVAQGVFDGAPVFTTRDGGGTWQEADLPLPEEAGGCEVSSISGSSGGTVYLEFQTESGGETAYIQLISHDWGETWQ